MTIRIEITAAVALPDLPEAAAAQALASAQRVAEQAVAREFVKFDTRIRCVAVRAADAPMAGNPS